MTTSVIITAFNEGIDLEGTVMDAIGGSVAPEEVIIVDDGSDTPVAPRFTGSPWQNVRVVQTPTRRGCAASRNYGVSQSADTDLIVILDSHMRMPHWWLECIQAAVAKHPNAIFCAACACFSTNWTTTFHGSGAKFQQGYAHVDPLWMEPGPADSIDLVPCILGACYAIPRRLWNALHGLNPNFYGWGQDEQDLSIRSWQLGYEVRRINQLVVPHRFNRKMVGNFLNTWQSGYNAAVLCMTVFEDGIYEERYEPYLREVFNAPEMWLRLHSEREKIMDFRRVVQSERKLTDAQVEAITGPIRHTVEQQNSLRAKRKPAVVTQPTITPAENVTWRKVTPILP